MKHYPFFSSMTKERGQEIPKTVPTGAMYREIGDLNITRIHVRDDTEHDELDEPTDIERLPGTGGLPRFRYRSSPGCV